MSRRGAKVAGRWGAVVGVLGVLAVMAPGVDASGCAVGSYGGDVCEPSVTNTDCLNPYQHSFDGQCNGPHASQGTMSGTASERAQKCANACLRAELSATEFPNGPEGFLLSSSGTCYCSSQPSASCSRSINTHTRYDFTGENSCCVIQSCTSCPTGATTLTANATGADDCVCQAGGFNADAYYSNLIAHYAFDGNTEDSIHPGNAATLSGSGGIAELDATEKLFGSHSVKLTNDDGKQTYIDIPSFSFQTALTISLWFRWDLTGFHDKTSTKLFRFETGGNIKIYLTIDTSQFTTTQENLFLVFYDGSNNRIEYRNDDGLAFANNVWYNIVCVINQNSAIKVFRNGIYVPRTNTNYVEGSGSYPLWTASSTVTMNNNRIGSHVTGAKDTIDGYVDEFRLYDTALSDVAVKNLYDRRGMFCLSCPTGTTTLAAGATRLDDCVCQAASYHQSSLLGTWPSVSFDHYVSTLGTMPSLPHTIQLWNGVSATLKSGWNLALESYAYGFVRSTAGDSVFEVQGLVAGSRYRYATWNIHCYAASYDSNTKCGAGWGLQDFEFFVNGVKTADLSGQNTYTAANYEGLAIADAAGKIEFKFTHTIEHLHLSGFTVEPVCQSCPTGTTTLTADATRLDDCVCESGSHSHPKTTNGDACFFPFTYEGTTYNECIITEGYAPSWCGIQSTVTSGDAQHSTWGDCASKTLTETKTLVIGDTNCAAKHFTGGEGFYTGGDTKCHYEHVLNPAYSVVEVKFGQACENGNGCGPVYLQIDDGSGTFRNIAQTSSGGIQELVLHQFSYEPGSKIRIEEVGSIIHPTVELRYSRGCTSCPTGTTTLSPGATRADDCVCQAGSFEKPLPTAVLQYNPSVTDETLDATSATGHTSSATPWNIDSNGGFTIVMKFRITSNSDNWGALMQIVDPTNPGADFIRINRNGVNALLLLENTVSGASVCSSAWPHHPISYDTDYTLVYLYDKSATTLGFYLSDSSVFVKTCPPVNIVAGGQAPCEVTCSQFIDYTSLVARIGSRYGLDDTNAVAGKVYGVYAYDEALSDAQIQAVIDSIVVGGVDDTLPTTECHSCPTGTTTLAANATGADDCVCQAGGFPRPSPLVSFNPANEVFSSRQEDLGDVTWNFRQGDGFTLFLKFKYTSMANFDGIFEFATSPSANRIFAKHYNGNYYIGFAHCGEVSSAGTITSGVFHEIVLSYHTQTNQLVFNVDGVDEYTKTCSSDSTPFTSDTMWAGSDMYQDYMDGEIAGLYAYDTYIPRSQWPEYLDRIKTGSLDDPFLCQSCPTGSTTLTANATRLSDCVCQAASYGSPGTLPGYADDNFESYTDTPLSSIKENVYDHTLSNGFKVRLSGWTYTRSYARGFLLNQAGSAYAEVYNLKPGHPYQYAIVCSTTSDSYKHNVEFNVNGGSNIIVYQDDTTSPSHVGKAFANADGTILFTFFYPGTDKHVHLSGLSIAPTCESCPTGTTTLTANATRAEDCVCESGSFDMANSVPLGTRLKAHYRFDSDLQDETGLTGALTGNGGLTYTDSPAHIAGRAIHTRSVGPITASMPVKLSDLMAYADGFSISFWFKSDPLPAGGKTDTAAALFSFNSGSSTGFIAYLQDSKTVKLRVYPASSNDNNLNYASDTNGVDLYDMTWHQLTFSFDKQSSGEYSVDFFVDGSEMSATESSTTITILSNTVDGVIGSNGAKQAGVSMDGFYADWRIYDVALTAEDAQNLAKSAVCASCPPTAPYTSPDQGATSAGQCAAVGSGCEVVDVQFSPAASGVGDVTSGMVKYAVLNVDSTVTFPAATMADVLVISGSEYRYVTSLPVSGAYTITVDTAESSFLGPGSFGVTSGGGTNYIEMAYGGSPPADKWSVDASGLESTCDDKNAIGTESSSTEHEHDAACLQGGNSAWLQLDLGEQTYVTGIVTQGRPCCAQWVTKYTVQGSTDGSSWSDMTCQNVDANAYCIGNTDNVAKVSNNFAQVVKVRYVRLSVEDHSGYASIRMSVYKIGIENAITGTPVTYTAPQVVVQYHAIACSDGCTTVADPSVAPTVPPDVRDGLIAQYKFDDLGGGEGVLDSSGNGKTLTAYNVRYENLAWKSKDLDTDVDYFEIANDGYFSPQKLTISFWIKMDTNEFGTVASCRVSPGWKGWMIYHNSGNKLLFWTGTSSTWDSVQLDNAFDGTWQHFVITVDGTSATNNVEIFRDMVSQGKNSKGYARAMANNMRIGEGGNEAAVPWDPITSNSYLDEFRLYDRVLSPSEINTVYEHSSHLLPSAITPAVVDPSVKSKFLAFDQLGTTTLEFTDATTAQALLVSGTTYRHVPTLDLSSGPYTVTVAAGESKIVDASGVEVAGSAGGTEYTMQKDYIFIKENAWCDGVTSTMKYSHSTNPQRHNGQAAIAQACLDGCSASASFNINPGTGACFCFDDSSEECAWDTDSTYWHYDIVAGSFFNNITTPNMKYFFPQVILRYDSEVCSSDAPTFAPTGNVTFLLAKGNVTVGDITDALKSSITTAIAGALGDIAADRVFIDHIKPSPRRDKEVNMVVHVEHDDTDRDTIAGKTTEVAAAVKDALNTGGLNVCGCNAASLVNQQVQTSITC